MTKTRGRSTRFPRVNILWFGLQRDLAHDTPLRRGCGEQDDAVA